MTLAKTDVSSSFEERFKEMTPQEICLDSGFSIKTERLLLRPVVVADVTDRYVSWLNDPEVNKYSRRSGLAHTIEDVKRYVEKKRKSPNDLLIGLHWFDSGEHIGNILFGPIDHNNRVAEMSNLIGERGYWGKRISIESGRYLLDFAFQYLNIHKVTLGNVEPNVPAFRKSRRLGFQVEGWLREQVIWNDEPTDVIRLGLLRHEFYRSNPEFPVALDLKPLA